MNFSELTTELADRGFDHLSPTRRGRLVNLAYTELCEQAQWPFLRATATGTAPLTITDLRTVESVTDSTNDLTLTPTTRGFLADEYPDLPDTGNPLWWYFNGQQQVSVYPASTSVSLSVVYFKVPAELSGTDPPVIPTRYHYAIVDYAAARAYAENGDADQAVAARQEGDRLVAFMVENLIDAQTDGAAEVVRGSGEDW